MNAPVNLRSEQILREFEFERAVQQAAERRGALAADPEYHPGTGRGAPVAWLLLALILFVMGLALGRLFWAWLAAGG